MKRFGLPVVMAVLALAPLLSGQSALEVKAPESVGFSAQRLSRLGEGMKQLIDQQQLAGSVTLVARHGQVVRFEALGHQDLASMTPMKRDTIFRIYSMTKPITGVAMMMLYEEGKWHPDDPLARHIPEFASLRVFERLGADGKPETRAPNHAPTVGEVMTHTAGFTYGVFGASPVDKLYQADNPLTAPTLQAFITKLAALPLAYQPGEAWVYSVAVDVQGYLVEKLSGKTLPQFMQERIFDPLGMVDTGFAVPAAKLSRLATIYSMDGQPRRLTPVRRDPDISTVPGLPSGGGGLYSTATDYFRFAQMLLNGGVYGGKRLLSPSSVTLMRANHLSDKLLTGGFGIGLQRIRPGFGFGYDVAVFDDPSKVGSTTGKGTYLWDGLAGTWFWNDPSNDVVFIGMIQRMAGAGSPNTQNLSRALVHQALVDPAK